MIRLWDRRGQRSIGEGCFFFSNFPYSGKDRSQEEKGKTEDEMVGWHHRLDGHEFEQALGVGDRQGSLVCFLVHEVAKSWT